MADLLAKETTRNLKLERNQAVEGEIILIGDTEIILDLGSKAEGTLSKKDFSPDQIEKLKLGDKITAFVLRTENESGQVVLGLNRIVPTGKGSHQKNWDRFISAKSKSQVFRGKALELNRGGLVVEVEGVRGFLPASQVTLSQAGKIDELVGQDLQVTVIEVEPSQNRLIFSQKTNVSQETKDKLAKFKSGDKVKGQVSAVLPFGVSAKFDDGTEGLAHISELSWDKVEDPNTLFKAGDEVEGVVTSIDLNTGRINFSIKQGSVDPFAEIAKKFQPEDVVSGVVSKVSSLGVSVELGGGVEGLIHTSKVEADMDYTIGKKITLLVDSVDSAKRRVNVVPFLTSTKDLIYK